MHKHVILIGALFVVLAMLAFVAAQRLDQIRTPYDLARYEPSGQYLPYAETIVNHPDGSFSIVPPSRFMDNNIRRSLERKLRSLLKEKGSLPEPQTAAADTAPAGKRKEATLEIMGKKMKITVLSGEELAKARAEPRPEEDERLKAEEENARRLQQLRRRMARMNATAATAQRDVVIVEPQAAPAANATAASNAPAVTGSAVQAEDEYVQGEES